MERISIFNYESFYLDFLEGNLSKEDAALLLAFLELHPDLKLEEESLAFLENDAATLDAKFKSNLKHVNFENTSINTENIEQFLIAETEKLLSTNKKNELDLFVANNHSLLTLQKIYASTHLIADPSIVFADKESLKRSRRIVLWPYISFAAAASVALLFFMWNSTTDVVSPSTTHTISKQTIKPQKVTPSKKKSIEKGTHHNDNRTDNNPVQVIDEQNPVVVAEIEKRPKISPIINSLKLKKIKQFNRTILEQKIMENNSSSNSIIAAVEEEKDDYAILGFNEMNNPIRPITKRLANVVKQEVDFRSAKATQKRSGGFYLKLGKLEISHRTSKK